MEGLRLYLSLLDEIDNHDWRSDTHLGEMVVQAFHQLLVIAKAADDVRLQCGRGDHYTVPTSRTAMRRLITALSELGVEVQDV